VSFIVTVFILKCCYCKWIHSFFNLFLL